MKKILSFLFIYVFLVNLSVASTVVKLPKDIMTTLFMYNVVKFGCQERP